MWPKRKLLVLIPHGAEGGQGFQALLEALQIDYLVRETSAEGLMDLTNLAIPGVEGDQEEFPDCGPTELVYWPEVEEEDGYRQWGLAHGVTQILVQDFLHNLWKEEVLLPTGLATEEEGQPLLWKLLVEAGYEPTLLWPESEGKWKAIRGRGLHWVVPESWLMSFFANAEVGRKPRCWFPEAYWQIRDEFVDFYSEPQGFRFVGTLPRYPEAHLERPMYDALLQAIQLGVTWLEIKKNIRWNVDALERDRGSEGDEGLAEDAQYLENRWYS